MELGCFEIAQMTVFAGTEFSSSGLEVDFLRALRVPMVEKGLP
jgi:hypothetical protein